MIRLTHLPIEGLDLSRCTSPFGIRIHPITKKRSSHNGCDFAYPLGTPIKASHDGLAIVSANASAGNYVVLREGSGYETHYYHMSKHVVKNGKRVKAGDVLGYVGTTGSSTGNHLHFGIRQNGEYLDPMPYLTYCIEKELDMTKEELLNSITTEEASDIYRKICAPLRDNDAMSYSLEARDWAVKTGLVEGDGKGNYSWELPLSREQFVTILKRFYDSMKEEKE